MRSHTFRTLVALGVSVSLVAACGGDDDTDADDAPAATDAPEPATTDAAPGDTEPDASDTSEPVTSEPVTSEPDTSEPDTSAPDLQLDEPVRIGLIIPQTGSAAIPQVFEDPMAMAIEAINAAGGIGGQPVEVRTYDSGFAPEQGLTALRRALEDDPTVLMGYAITSQVLAAAPLLAEAQIPMIHFSAADETNISEGGSDWTFRVKLQNSSQASAGAQFLIDELGATDFGLMYTNDNYGQTARDAAEATILENGGTVVADRSYAFDATDLTEQVLAMAEADAVLNWGFPNTIGLQLNQFAQNGIQIPTMDSDSGVLTFENQLAEPEAMEQFYAAVVCNPPGDERQYVLDWTAQFEEQFGYTPEANSAFTWDGVYMFKQAIEQAGSTDGTAIRDAMQSITWDGGVCQENYRADEDNNLSHDAFIVFFGNGESETVAIYRG